MNTQQTFTDAEYAQRKQTGGWEKFLDTMDAIILRAAFEEKIAPFYPKSGRRGRPPKGIELMLWMYFPHVRYNPADEAPGKTFTTSTRCRSSCGRVISKRTCRTRRRF